MLSRKQQKKLNRLIDLSDPSHGFAKYFAELELCVNQPSLAFVGAHLAEILNCTEAVPTVQDFETSEARLNFGKLVRLDRLFDNMSKIPEGRRYPPVPFLVELITNFRGNMNVKLLFALSKELEPPVSNG